MTTKFSRRPASNKPPHICRKPPEGPTYTPEDLTLQPFQGFITYYNQYSPTEGGLSAPIALTPAGPPLTWNGTATGEHYEAKLFMAASLSLAWLDFRFDWYVSNVLAETFILTNLTPKAWDPFDSGYVKPPELPPTERAAWRIWF